MDRLSACYFCGAATVADLGVVRVAGDDGAAGVTLCGDCTEKLDRLAGSVDAGIDLSVADDTAPEAPRTTGDGTGTAPDRSHETATGADAPERSPDSEPTTGDSDDADDPGGVAVGQPDEPGPADAEAVSRAGGDADGDDDAGDPDSGPGKTGGDPSDTRSVTASQAAGGRRESSHGTRRRSGGRSSPDEDAADAGGSGDGESSDGGSDGLDPSGEDVATVPRETYNKVVRLLQNRSFPVERSSVIDVATSAYGLSRRDCEAAIDALVNRDILEESDDGRRLHRS